jgi:hypothetical protein
LWVQSWITPQIRQERVAMRISTNQEAVRIRLPKRVRQSSVLTAVNGREVEGSFRVPGLLVVAVPPAEQGRECVLEVCFSIDPPELQIGLMNDDLQTAQVEQATGPRRFYWQLVLPDDLHLVVAPRDMAAEMAWSSSQATGWLRSRRPVMDQRQLEAWIKASRQEALPQGVNEYLFGGLGQWPTMHIVAGHRTLIVSLASSGILVLGLLLLHVPALRNPGVLLFVAISLAGLALAAPDAALLGAQSAVFGVAVMIVAAAWIWMLSRQAVLIPAGGNITTARREGSSLQSAPRQRERSSRITSTAAAGPLMEARP